MRTEAIVMPDVAGRCRWCQCTARRPCPCGCSWGNARRSLCSACVDIDALARTPAGRKFLARLLQPIMAAATRAPRRKGATR
jgi:hypothetical protein